MTRVMVIVVALLAPQHRDRPQFDWWPENPLIRWDAGHYWGILTQGYPEQIKDTTAFFPLYPMLAWPVWKAIMFLDTLTTGYAYAGKLGLPRNAFSSELALVITSHAAAIAALVVFYRWCAEIAGRRAAFVAGLLLSAFPTAMYFSTGYAESVFVLCVALALRFVQKRRAWAACIACAAATATRPTGIVLAAVVLLMLLMQDADRPWGRRLLRLIPLGVVSIGGMLGHIAFLKVYYGRADAYFVAQRGWPHSQPDANSWVRAVTFQPVLEPAWKPFKYAFRGEFGRLTDARNWNYLINVLMVGLSVVGFCRPGRVPRFAFLLSILVFLLAWQDDPIDGGRLLGIARYHLIGLPVLLWLADRPLFGRTWLAPALLIAASLVLQCFYISGYVDWILVS
ncbi:MAG: glycosyltransferase family 39 protein [Planctomycetes bacterium]|nr:glycosyltransferase family 39 protein [Planctomycetota bacterium]